MSSFIPYLMRRAGAMNLGEVGYGHKSTTREMIQHVSCLLVKTDDIHE